MKFDVKNIKGEQVRSIELPDSIFNVELSAHVVHGVVKAYRANRRQGTHATKTRSLVRGGGKKPFKQKGTGNARQGTSRAPNMPGGAVVHGPLPRSYDQKINKKTKCLALKMILSDKLRNNNIHVVDDFELSGFSTKHVGRIMQALSVKSSLLADERKDNYLYASARNMKKASAKSPAELNVEDLLRYESLVISENGLSALSQRLGEK